MRRDLLVGPVLLFAVTAAWLLWPTPPAGEEEVLPSGLRVSSSVDSVTGTVGGLTIDSVTVVTRELPDGSLHIWSLAWAEAAPWVCQEVEGVRRYVERVVLADGRVGLPRHPKVQPGECSVGWRGSAFDRLDSVPLVGEIVLRRGPVERRQGT